MVGAWFSQDCATRTLAKMTGQGKVPRVSINGGRHSLKNAQKIHESLIIVVEVRLDTPLFGDMVVSCPGGSWRCRAASKEVPGGQEKPSTSERWPESSGRGLDDDFQVEAFVCQVWSFSVPVQGWLRRRWRPLDSAGAL